MYYNLNDSISNAILVTLGKENFKKLKDNKICHDAHSHT